MALISRFTSVLDKGNTTKPTKDSVTWEFEKSSNDTYDTTIVTDTSFRRTTCLSTLTIVFRDLNKLDETMFNCKAKYNFDTDQPELTLVTSEVSVRQASKSNDSTGLE